MKPYYTCSGITIYHGDSRVIVPELMGGGTVKFDLLLTDPAYGIGADSVARATARQRIAANGKTNAGRGWKDYGDSDWDLERTPPELLHAAIACAENAIVWGGNYFADFLPPTMGWLVWDKMQRDFSLADGELAWTSFQKALRIFSVSRGEAILDVKQHPTQKSLEVMRRSLLYADRAGGKMVASVLDPFMGSGTTLRACKDLARKCVGIDKEERYCEIAASRLRQEVLL